MINGWANILKLVYKKIPPSLENSNSYPSRKNCNYPFISPLDSLSHIQGNVKLLSSFLPAFSQRRRRIIGVSQCGARHHRASLGVRQLSLGTSPARKFWSLSPHIWNFESLKDSLRYNSLSHSANGGLALIS